AVWGVLPGLVIYGLSRQLSTHRLPRIWLSVLLTSELGLLGLCWFFLVQGGYWVPWVPAALASLATVAGLTVYDHFQLRQHFRQASTHSSNS
ncbi:MAG: hypothetical protein AAGF24_04380, partial [Cyanobacteria bacterium P01_H01_bin.121]